MLLPFQRGLPTSVLGPEANPLLLRQKELGAVERMAAR
jgi:hypothetical protein